MDEVKRTVFRSDLGKRDHEEEGEGDEEEDREIRDTRGRSRSRSFKVKVIQDGLGKETRQVNVPQRSGTPVSLAVADGEPGGAGQAAGHSATSGDVSLRPGQAWCFGASNVPHGPRQATDVSSRSRIDPVASGMLLNARQRRRKA